MVVLVSLRLPVLRRDNLNSQFIVTAHMDFQISDFRCNTVNTWHFSPAPSSALIGGWGLGNLEIE